MGTRDHSRPTASLAQRPDRTVTELVAPIASRVSSPDPDEVRTARERAGLTQAQAAEMVSPAQKVPYKTWAAYELPIGNPNRRSIPLASWELFLLLTGQHATIRAVFRESGIPVSSTGESVD